LRNSLNGRSHGIEFTLQRRSANRLSGWVSYAYGRSRFSDPDDQLSFWGNYDQRHTLNAYGSYRVTDTINLSGKYRFGTSFPLPGFYAYAGNYADLNYLALTEQRNQTRLPNYSRLDLRFSKAIYRQRRKLTFYTGGRERVQPRQHWMPSALHYPGCAFLRQRVSDSAVSRIDHRVLKVRLKTDETTCFSGSDRKNRLRRGDDNAGWLLVNSPV
jgi:hypothetical protein